jgi:hypothetical protein
MGVWQSFLNTPGASLGSVEAVFLKRVPVRGVLDPPWCGRAVRLLKKYIDTLGFDYGHECVPGVWAVP